MESRSKLKKLKNRNNPKNFKKKKSLQEAIEKNNDMHFEDQWEDEWEDEVVEDFTNNYKVENNKVKEIKKKENFTPFLGKKSDLKSNQQLDYSNKAYKMFHRASTEWPCLSIDFIADVHDPYEIRKRDFSIPTKNFKYPLDLLLVGGSQAPSL